MAISPAMRRPQSKAHLRPYPTSPSNYQNVSPSTSDRIKTILDATLARDPVPNPFHPSFQSPTSEPKDTHPTTFPHLSLSSSAQPSIAEGAHPSSHLLASPSLNHSTSSRADTHTAFTFDSYSPRTENEHSPLFGTTAFPNKQTDGHEFEVVSYTESSPHSDHHVSTGSAVVPRTLAGAHLIPYDDYNDHDDENETDLEDDTYGGYEAQNYRKAYPTPSTSPSFVAALHQSQDHTKQAQHGHHHHHHPNHLTAQQHELYTATSYPHIAAAAVRSNDIFSLTDEQLDRRFEFLQEIGFGNWGRVYLARPRPLDARFEKKYPQYSTLGLSAASSGGVTGAGLIAIKFVHRETTPTTTARVRALWGEMKVIRSLKHEPHPSIVQFEAFVISPSFALVIMPFFPGRIEIPLDITQAKPYFRQLASAVGYLHERGVTHNDIKPANVLISYNDIPVLVDFGFANRWDMSSPHCFLSSLSWGTPEYLDPQRAMGLPHDERASDVWALGITMYEILVGRTPFEKSAEEAFDTPEEMLVYYERTRRGKWYGDFPMPSDMRHLLKSMICPDPAYRITATQVYHHPALAAEAPSVIITPHFVRAAVGESGDALPPVPADYATMLNEANAKGQLANPKQNHKEKGSTAATAVNGEKKKRKKRRSGGGAGTNGKPLTRASAPALALGESIKQHTATGTAASGAKSRVVSGVNGVAEENSDSPNRERYVIKKTREDGQKWRGAKVKGKGKVRVQEDDPTPTKVFKPAEPLPTKDAKQPRVSQSQTTTLSRPTSNTSINVHNHGDRNSLLTKTTSRDSRRSFNIQPVPSPSGDPRDSILSATSSITSTGHVLAPRTKAEAVLRTMRSLEGGNKSDGLRRDFVAHIKRPAPPAPSGLGSRPSSVDSALTLSESGKGKVVEPRRSTVFERVLDDVKEEDRSPVKPFKSVVEGLKTDEQGDEESEKSKETTKVVEEEGRRKNRMNSIVGSKPPVVDTVIDTTAAFPRSEADTSLAGLREKILSEDKEKLARYRTTSGGLGHLVPGQTPSSPARRAKESTAPDAVGRHGLGAFDTGSRLDRLAEWVKNVERIVEDARRALAEGREPPLPDLPLPSDFITPAPNKPNSNPDPTSLSNITSDKLTKPSEENRVETVRRSFGVSPEKAIPAHLRTDSTQVEPSTPPKWMTLAEAEERVKAANSCAEEGGKKRMAPIKKERPTVAHVLKLFGADKDQTSSRSNTPDPSTEPKLKPLRGVPSTPALRSFATYRVPTRKSESNLRNFNTVPSSSTPPLDQAQVILNSNSALVHGSDSETDTHRQIGQGDGALTGGLVQSRRNPGSVHRQKVYEQLLDSTPGVARLGEGWGSSVYLPPPPPLPTVVATGNGNAQKEVGKSSSIASLRDRARAVFVGGDKRHQQQQEIRGKDKERRFTSSTTLTNLAAAPTATANVSSLVNDIDNGEETRSDPFASHPHIQPSTSSSNTEPAVIITSATVSSKGGAGATTKERRNSFASTILMSATPRPATPSVSAMLNGIEREQGSNGHQTKTEAMVGVGASDARGGGGKGSGGLFKRFGVGKKQPQVRGSELERLEESSP